MLINKISDFMDESTFQKLCDYSKNLPTPHLILVPNIALNQYKLLTSNLTDAHVYYAVKSCPNDNIISLLHKNGSNFDCATVPEILHCVRLGVPPTKLSFGNTIKKSSDIKLAYDIGVRLFVSDSIEDLHKIAQNAPGSKIFFRLLTTGEGADWPLSRKFGTSRANVIALAKESKRLGLSPYGISFHVGSQQKNLTAWENPIQTCAGIFDELKKDDIHLEMINLGGGLPSNVFPLPPDMSEYAKHINTYIDRHFSKKHPTIFIEPGRYIAGNAGVLVTDVILHTNKDGQNWTYLDIGLFGGLIETIGESIKYPIYIPNKSSSTAPNVIAGPTCDSMDILYEKYQYNLPTDLTEGDKVYILTTGAYTTSYSAVYFNGIAPLKEYILY